jgi:hypothetical protein
MYPCPEQFCAETDIKTILLMSELYRLFHTGVDFSPLKTYPKIPLGNCGEALSLHIAQSNLNGYWQ